MTREEALKTLKKYDREALILSDIVSTLSFDQETQMPVKGAEERSSQIAMIAALHHEKLTCDELREAVSTLENAEDLGDEGALVKSYVRFYKGEGKLPSSFVEEEARLHSASQVEWAKARENNDFKSYAPTLTKVFALAREKAGLINRELNAYDCLLDLYEEGERCQWISSVFDPLEETIHSILDKIGDKKIESSFLYVPFDEARVHAFCLDVIKKMGYDFERGNVSISAHPFTSYLGMDDIRITTRYTDPSYFDSIATIVHECGHALYDLNASLNPAIRGTSIGYGTSMSLHESQSRFWENMLLRRHSFVEAIYPSLRKAVAELNEVKLDDFYRAINRGEPSAVRVNADELTYPLHIILRYRLEKAMVEGSLEVKDLEEAWNEGSKKIIRYSVKSPAEGCLQDVHWAEGLIGYFPSYLVGSIAAAAFMKTLEEKCGGSIALDEEIRGGNWAVVTDFQREEIWKYGSIYDFLTTVRRVTGGELDVNVYTSYLASKYGEIYNFQ